MARLTAEWCSITPMVNRGGSTCSLAFTAMTGLIPMGPRTNRSLTRTHPLPGFFGLAINDDARPLAPSYGPGERIDDAPSEAVIFTLLDATGQPVTGATLGWTVRASRIRVDFPPFPADLRGQVVIDVPRRLIVGLQYKASAPNGSTAAGELKPNADGSLPLNPVLKVE